MNPSPNTNAPRSRPSFRTHAEHSVSLALDDRARHGGSSVVAHVLAALFVVLGATASARAQSAVHVVSGGGGDTLQLAIDAAASGDTVLVHGGDFGPIRIVGKALTIVSEPSQSTRVAGLRVANTTASQRTTIAGLRVVTPASTDGTMLPCVEIDQCSGSVRLESLQASLLPPAGHPALRVSGSPDVALFECTWSGSSAIVTTLNPAAWTPNPAVTLVSSRVAAYDCVVTGGRGLDGVTTSPCSNPFVFFNTSGAAGVVVDANSTWCSTGGSITGGAGGHGVDARCSCFTAALVPGTVGSNGGAGIDNAVGSTSAQLGTSITGGAAGPGGLPAFCGGPAAGGMPAGTAGPASTNAVTILSGAPVRITASSIVRAGQPLSLTLQGTPGDVALVGQSFEARWLPVFASSGVLLVGPSGRRVPVGTFPTGGTLTIAVPTSLTPVGAQGTSWYLQAFALDALGTLRVGDGAVVTVVDPMF